MSIEEIIEELDKLAKKHEVCAGSPSLKPLAETYRRTAKILRAAVEKLKTHPAAQPSATEEPYGCGVPLAGDNQPNEPLTLEELREMDGQPVWVKCSGTTCCWGLVSVRPSKIVVRDQYGMTSDVNVWMPRGEKYYRRPPEEATL